MKKLIAVVVAVLVLLMFLMVNYLMWDKENLMKKSENDRIEQDWLRGQNRTLQSTIAEQEKEKAILVNENKSLQERLEELSTEVKAYADRENEYIKTIELKKSIVASYKQIAISTLQGITEKWLLDVTSAEYESAFELLATDHRFFGRKMTRDVFDAYLQKNIVSLALVKDESGVETVLFEMAGNESDDLTIRVRTRVDVLLAETKDENVGGLTDGQDVLVITFRYIPDTEKWGILQLTAE